ncbi:MAG: aminotransferase class IV [Phycisphaerales bacterium]|nr:aminotransferase class IV [Phycisphaerales bacterium]
MPDIACVNGEFCDVANARVSIEDRGFQFADGVYEVIVAPGGVPFLLEAHLERLASSLAGIELRVDLAELRVAELVKTGIERCGYRDVMVYIQITRGVASRNHAMPERVTPTVVMTFKAKPVYDAALRKDGVALKTVRDNRWARCNIKSIALLANILLKQEARAAGFFDALIVSDDDIVRETAAANVFIVRDGVLRTPPKSTHILYGITRDHLLAQARKLDIPCDESDFDRAMLLSADEVFITSSTMEVMPVTRVDENAIGDGKVGAMTRRLFGCFN